MSIYDVISSIWRNHPRGATTFSNCCCGRAAKRGSEPCLLCLRDMLTSTGKVTEQEVDALYAQITLTVNLEAALIEQIGESARL